MDCKRCEKTVHGLSNYGSNENPLCYDCSVVIEKERGINPEEMKTVTDFVKRLFNPKNGSELRTSQGNLSYAVVGFVGLPISFFFPFGITKFDIIGILPYFVLTIITLVFSIFCILLGLYHIRSTINLETRQVIITRRNWAFYKRKFTETFPLESIQINAILFSDVPTTWMVRIGCGDYAILSKEFYSVRERNAAMLALLKKIFPEYAYMDESFIIEESNQAFFRQQEIINP